MELFPPVYNDEADNLQREKGRNCCTISCLNAVAASQRTGRTLLGEDGCGGRKESGNNGLVEHIGVLVLTMADMSKDLKVVVDLLKQSSLSDEDFIPRTWSVRIKSYMATEGDTHNSPVLVICCGV